MKPKTAFDFWLRGTEYENKGQFDLAISDYTKAIELYPEYFPAYQGWGIAYDKNSNTI